MDSENFLTQSYVVKAIDTEGSCARCLQFVFFGNIIPARICGYFLLSTNFTDFLHNDILNAALWFFWYICVNAKVLFRWTSRKETFRNWTTSYKFVKVYLRKIFYFLPFNKVFSCENKPPCFFLKKVFFRGKSLKLWKYRSRSEMFCKIGALKNFAKFSGSDLR